MKLTHIRLLVSDFDECFRFYRDVMGFPVAWGEEGSGYADFDTGGSALALFVREDMANAVGTGHLPSSVEAQDRLLLIFAAGDLEATVSQLKARGGRFVTGIVDHPEWGIRTAHLRDPDGNLIELNSPMPQEEWTEGLREESTKYEAT